MNLTYTDKGADGFFSLSPIKTALVNSVIRTAKVVEDAAIEDYSHKRKTDKPPFKQSLIVNSFNYDLKEGSEFKAIAVVQAGGPMAPHFVLVEEPHKLKGGKGMWPGYHILDAGMEEGEKQVDNIIREEFGEKVMITGGK